MVIPIYSASDRITVGPNIGRASILGLKPDTVQDKLVVTDGTFLRGGDGVLVGPTLASDFSLVLGSRIELGTNSSSTKEVRVVGILQSAGFGAGLSTDRSIVASDTWYLANGYGESGQYQSVNIIASDISQIGTIENNTAKELNRNPKLPVIRISDSGSFLNTISTTIGSLTSFVTMLGAISLVVAAVSIFNVMIMSVTERIKEIGILRSIGTRKSEIRKMFLYEAIIIGLIGATIGALLSILSGYLTVLAIVGNTTYFFTPASMLYIPQGMLIGVATCVLSGVYPAWRAADLDPIEALRAE